MAGGARRGEAGAGFPNIPLRDVLEMARIIEVRGGRCRFDELATTLGQTKTSGAFRGRTGAGRQFGVVETVGSELVLTELGRRMALPDTEAEALAEAFLKVGLYDSLYARYAAEGGRLPVPGVIEADFVRLGVSPRWASRARQVFLRSAETAGYFRSGRDRLIRPSMDSATIAVRPSTTPEPKKPVAVSHAEAAVPMTEPSLMQGLVAKLPPEGERFTPKQRQRWLDAAKRILDFVYAGEDEDSDSASGSPNGVTASRQPSGV